MKKWISILSALLIVQLLVAVLVNVTGEGYGAFQPEQKLLVFDKTSVDGLRIEDGKHSVLLKKQDGKWLLPESADFPARPDSVEHLLDTLSGLKKGWPVAKTGAAASRFKVAEQQFERKLILLAGDKTLATLYVGSSPGFRKVHVRSADEDTIFAVAFNTWEANARSDDWIDKDILGLDEADISRVEMPGLVLQREDSELKLVGLADDEQADEQALRDLLAKLAGLRIGSLLGSESKPEYRQQQPELVINVTRKNGEVLNYRFSRPTDGTYYVLKRSDMDRFFKVAGFTVDPIKETTRETLVRSKEKDAAGESTEDDSHARADGSLLQRSSE